VSATPLAVKPSIVIALLSLSSKTALDLLNEVVQLLLVACRLGYVAEAGKQ
jgi:hypothetical protein